MDYQKILEFVAPMDAFVLQHRYLAAVFRGVFLSLLSMPVRKDTAHGLTLIMI